MRNVPRLSVTALLALLVTAGTLSLSACGGGQPGVFSQQIAAADGGTVSFDGAITIHIPPGALSADATIEITRAAGDAPSGLESAVPVGEAFNVQLGGGAALTKPVTIEMAYDPDLLPVETPREVAFLAFYDEALGEWQPVYGTVNLDKHVIVIETDHLSWWQPRTWDISAVADVIMGKLNSLFESVGLPSAQIPDCGRAPTDMTLDFTETLLPCLEEGGSEGEALLKVANNRAYAVLLDLSRSEPRHRVEDQGVTRGSLYDAAWSALVDKVGDDVAYVPPAAEARLSIRFDGQGEVRLLSAPSDLTLGVEVLLAMLGPLAADPQTVADGVECLYEVINAGGDEPPTFGDLVDIAKDCASVVLDGTLGIVWNVVRNFVTLGAAAGELVVDRTLGDGRGQVTVAYLPRGAIAIPTLTAEPEAIPGPQQGVVGNPTTIVAGSFFTCVVTDRGGVKCWGDVPGVAVQPSEHSSVVDIQGLTSGVEAIAAYSNFVCALTVNGSVKCWGENSEGQLGHGTTTSTGFGDLPLDVVGLSSGVASITAGGEHACALTTAGSVMCWGNNWAGQLGNGTSGRGTSASTPVDVAGLTDVQSIAAGNAHTCALTSEGTVKCWGAGYGLAPAEVAGLEGRVVSMATGGFGLLQGAGLTCVVTATGSVQCWASSANEHHTLGQVPGLETGVSTIGVGSGYLCAAMLNGAVKCFGANSDGRLGNGTTTRPETAVEVCQEYDRLEEKCTRLLSDAVEVVAVAAVNNLSFQYTCALTKTGHVMCWGWIGQLLGVEACISGGCLPVEVIGLGPQDR